MYFRNLPRSINSHRKTHNGPLFVLIRYEFFNDIHVSSYKTIIGSIGLRWWKKRIIHRIGTIVYFSENWSNSWWLDYIHTHTGLYIWNRFFKSFSSISRLHAFQATVLLSASYSIAIFRACAHFTLFRILSHLKELHYRSCEIQVSDPNRNTPDSWEKQVRARGRG